MSIVSSSGVLVNKESISQLPIKTSESCSTISSAKASVSFTVYSSIVKDFKIDTRNFAKAGKKVEKVGNQQQYLCKINKAHTLLLA